MAQRERTASFFEWCRDNGKHIIVALDRFNTVEGVTATDLENFYTKAARAQGERQSERAYGATYPRHQETRHPVGHTALWHADGGAGASATASAVSHTMPTCRASWRGLRKACHTAPSCARPAR